MNSRSLHKQKNIILWLTLIKGILMIVFGIWLMKSLNDNFQKLSIIFGLLILTGGLLEVSVAFNNRKISSNWEWTLISGVFDILLGAFLVANPNVVLLLVTLLISLWLFFRSYLLFRNAWALKKANEKRFIYPLVFGILFIVIALVFIWHPEIFGITMVFWTALAFISIGLFRIFLVFRYSR